LYCVLAVSERLSPAELAEAGPPEAVRLPLELVDQNPNNPRRDLSDIAALAENIRTFGLLQPVTVRRIGERYELLGGHRRRAAFEMLQEREPQDVQWRSIPAVVRTADDDRAFLMLLSSQLHTRSWRPREEAAALERLALGGLTLRQIGERLQRTESWTSKRLRVYADSVLSGYVQSGQLQATIAEELLVLDAEVKAQFAKLAVSEQWSQAHARAEVRKLTVDLRLRDVGRLTRELLDILSSVEPSRIPIEIARDLQVLRGRIDAMSGREVRIPSIEEAQRRAGVKTQDRPLKRGQRRKPGYKPKL
jgi:ParB family chromosome partitioning protein